MVDTFQREIPPARINITLDVETNGAKKRKELPLKLLAIGDYSNKQTSGPLAKRQRLNINRHNFDQTLASLKPRLRFSVPNRLRNKGDSELAVDLTIDAMHKFQPEAIINAVPELRDLLAMRNLLRDLKANILDNNALRRELEKIIKNKQARDSLKTELLQQAPLTTSRGQ